MISEKNYDKFVKDAILLRAYLPRSEKKVILACNIFKSLAINGTSSHLPLSETSLGLSSIFNAFLMAVTTIKTKTKNR